MNDYGGTRQAMLDSCPGCLEVAAPYIWGKEGESIKAIYKCSKCGRRWPCWWAADIKEGKADVN